MNKAIGSLCALLFSFLLFAACGTGIGNDAANDSGSTTTRLNAVTGLSVEKGNGQNTLSWNALSGASYYNLYWDALGSSRSLALVADCSGDAFRGVTNTFFIHTGLQNGVRYSYSIVAVTGRRIEGECSAHYPGGTVSATPEVIVLFGCTNSNATNYDPSATNDDGSCSVSSSGGNNNGGSSGGGSVGTFTHSFGVTQSCNDCRNCHSGNSC